MRFEEAARLLGPLLSERLRPASPVGPVGVGPAVRRSWVLDRQVERDAAPGGHNFPNGALTRFTADGNVSGVGVPWTTPDPQPRGDTQR